MTSNCSSCGATNREGATFCLGCGARLGAEVARQCKHCGVDNRLDDSFCKACGGSLPAGAGTTAVMPVMPLAPEPGAVPRTRKGSKAPIIAFAAVACLLVAGLGVIVLTGGSGDDQVASNESGDDDQAEAQPDPRSDTAETTSSTVATTDGVESTDQPTTTNAAARVIPTTMPATTTTALLPPPVTPVPVPPVRYPGDLGLAQSMTRPPCDETRIAVLASGVDSATNATVIGAALERYPGSQYLKTAETCPSLRPDLNGEPIYVVYFGPFATTGEACTARLSGPEDAYVRILSPTVPNTHQVDC